MISTLTLVLKLLCGVALFLYGMGVMGDGLKKVAGNKLESLLYKLTSTPVKGILLGAGVTAVIQSSSATTVMVVGFVNSGMMKVGQAIGIIMGANIGTSITGWILCLSYIEGSEGIASLLSTATISAVVAIIGIILRNFAKKSQSHHLGEIMLGFAVLMTGMQLMSGAVSPLKDSPGFINALTMFSNPIMGILIGIAFTAVLQSASASIGILQALSVTGGIAFSTAFPITMGIGVGAACPVLLSSIGANKNGKRTALIYLLNDVFGLVIWSTVFYTANAIVGGFPFMNHVMSPVAIALLNTCFRVATILILSPFIKYIEKLVFKLIKDSEAELAEQKDFELLDERFLRYPALALAQSHESINGMAKKTRKNIFRAMNLLHTYSESKYAKVQAKEALIDKYEDKLGTYLMNASRKEMNRKESSEAARYLRCLSDFERISDHACGVAHVAQELEEKKIRFSKAARAELTVLETAVEEIVNLSFTCFTEDDVETAYKVEPVRQLIDVMVEELKSRHISRLQAGVCSVEQGFPYNDLITNLDRVAAHCSNIAIAVIEKEAYTFDPHSYTKSVKARNKDEFVSAFDEYAAKYQLPSLFEIDQMAQSEAPVFDDVEETDELEKRPKNRKEARAMLKQAMEEKNDVEKQADEVIESVPEDEAIETVPADEEKQN